MKGLFCSLIYACMISILASNIHRERGNLNILKMGYTSHIACAAVARRTSNISTTATQQLKQSHVGMENIILENKINKGCL